MFRNFLLSGLVAVGMSSCSVMVIATASAGSSSLAPPAIVAPAR